MIRITPPEVECCKGLRKAIELQLAEDLYSAYSQDDDLMAHTQRMCLKAMKILKKIGESLKLADCGDKLDPIYEEAGPVQLWYRLDRNEGKIRDIDGEIKRLREQRDSDVKKHEPYLAKYLEQEEELVDGFDPRHNVEPDYEDRLKRWDGLSNKLKKLRPKIWDVKRLIEDTITQCALEVDRAGKDNRGYLKFEDTEDLLRKLAPGSRDCTPSDFSDIFRLFGTVVEEIGALFEKEELTYEQVFTGNGAKDIKPEDMKLWVGLRQSYRQTTGVDWRGEDGKQRDSIDKGLKYEMNCYCEKCKGEPTGENDQTKSVTVYSDRTVLFGELKSVVQSDTKTFDLKGMSIREGRTVFKVVGASISESGTIVYDDDGLHHINQVGTDNNIKLEERAGGEPRAFKTDLRYCREHRRVLSGAWTEPVKCTHCGHEFSRFSEKPIWEKSAKCPECGGRPKSPESDEKLPSVVPSGSGPRPFSQGDKKGRDGLRSRRRYGGRGEFELYPASTTRAIDRFFGLPEVGDISGTTTDQLFGTELMMNLPDHDDAEVGTGGRQEMRVALWNDRTRKFCDMPVLLPLVTMAKHEFHSILECALSLTLCGYLDAYQIGYYTTLMPRKSVGTDAIRSVLEKWENSPLNIHMIVDYDENGSVVGGWVKEDDKRINVKRLFDRLSPGEQNNVRERARSYLRPRAPIHEGAIPTFREIATLDYRSYVDLFMPMRNEAMKQAGGKQLDIFYALELWLRSHDGEGEGLAALPAGQDDSGGALRLRS